MYLCPGRRRGVRGDWSFFWAILSVCLAILASLSRISKLLLFSCAFEVAAADCYAAAGAAVFAAAAAAAGEVKRLKAYKPWAAQVASTPPPSTDPLAPPPKKTSKKGSKGGASSEAALVLAIQNKVGMLLLVRRMGVGTRSRDARAVAVLMGRHPIYASRTSPLSFFTRPSLLVCKEQLLKFQAQGS